MTREIIFTIFTGIVAEVVWRAKWDATQRDETMKQMVKAQLETVKEITTSHERTIETLWNA